MEADDREALIRVRIEKLVNSYMKGRKFSIEDYLKRQGISSLIDLSKHRKEQFADGIVDLLHSYISSGRGSIVRVELMSILKIGFEGMKITKDHIPSPKDHVLEKEMKEHFTKLKDSIKKELIIKHRINEKDRSKDCKQKVLKAVVTEVFGSMPKTELLYSRQLFNKFPLEKVIRKNLSTYMGEAKLKDESKDFVKTLTALVDSEQEQDSEGIDNDKLSRKLKDDFVDTNQFVIRKLKNELDVRDMGLVAAAKKQAILKGIMSYYFGQMSEEFLRLELEKMDLTKLSDKTAADRMKLINMIMHDCLHSHMHEDDAKKAHKKINDLIST
jgi:uncharacterized protein (DUF2249 family)